MNLVGACLLSFLAAGGEQTALAPATSEKINEAIIFTVPSLPAKRSYQRIVLASGEEARRLGLSPKELTLVKVRGAAQPRPMQWDERTKEPYFLLPAQAAGAQLGHHLAVVRLLKKSVDALRHHRADVTHLQQALKWRVHDGVQATEMPCQRFGGRLAHMANTQTKQKARQGGLL